MARSQLLQPKKFDEGITGGDFSVCDLRVKLPMQGAL